MIYILDTNVLSETMKPQPDAAVASWMRAQSLRSLYTTAISQAEILAGIAILPEGRRRTDLQRMAQSIFSEDFDGRVLPFGTESAFAYAELFAARRQAGRPTATADLVIAAIAHAYEATVVTRDIGGFSDCGLAIFNPWSYA
jgi:toxin FitB